MIQTADAVPLAWAPSNSVQDVERWNDAFAQEHDIDEYYQRSSALIRWIERKRLGTIRKLAKVRPGDRVLEVGCGGGHVLRLFPHARLTGVDVSGRMLEKAARNLHGFGVQLVKGELERLDWPAGSFDRIICSEVLEHVVDPVRLLGAMRRLMAPGGRAVVTLPNDHLVRLVKTLIHRTGLGRLGAFRRVAWGGDQYHLHVWSLKQMRELLAGPWRVVTERFVPSTLFPIRCCFLCLPAENGSDPGYGQGPGPEPGAGSEPQS